MMKFRGFEEEIYKYYDNDVADNDNNIQRRAFLWRNAKSLLTYLDLRAQYTLLFVKSISRISICRKQIYIHLIWRWMVGITGLKTQNSVFLMRISEFHLKIIWIKET